MEGSSSFVVDLSAVNVVFALVGLLFLIGALLNTTAAYQAIVTGKGKAASTIIGWLGCVGLGIALGKAAYYNTRKHHLLRVGPVRYTVATVSRSFFSRSGRKFVFHYRVGAYQGQGQDECGDRCPAVGTRRYVRFAAAAPDLNELTSYYVDDTVRVIPPLGWATLPLMNQRAAHLDGLSSPALLGNLVVSARLRFVQQSTR